jgi:hypothetical protein
MTVPLRVALYLRVSTARQAEHDVSIPDQKRQGETYCATQDHELAETFIEAGASATNDRQPEFQRMIEAGTSKPAPFDIVVVQREGPAELLERRPAADRLAHRRRRATRIEDQEEAGDRPAACRHCSADLPVVP